MSNALWKPAVVGDLPLPHRLAMTPTTRSRSTPQGVPTALNAQYFERSQPTSGLTG